LKRKKILSLPSQTARIWGFEKLIYDFKGRKIKRKKISKKSCQNEKELYFCTRFQDEALSVKPEARIKEDTFIDILD
jgi:hypothetical protein